MDYRISITRAWYQVITAFTSGAAATVNIGVNTDDAGGIQAALAFDNAVYTQAYHDGLPDGTIANFTTQTTAARDVIFRINDANLTAGKVRVWWEYVVGE